MNIVGLILGVCILSSSALGKKKRSPESDYWIQYEPIPQHQSKTNSRSEVSTNPQDNDNNVVYQDTGYGQYAYPMPAAPQGQNPVQQVPNAVAQVSPTQTGQQVCHLVLDLGIILDSSYTVEGTTWQEEKRTAQALIDKLDVDENGVHVAVMAYGTEVEIAVPFNSYKDDQQLKKYIEDIDFMNGWSRTDLALAAAKQQLFNGSRESKDGIPKALIVMSDGRTDGESLPDHNIDWNESIKPVVDELRRDGVKIFCIGVGDVDTTELNVIASDKNNVFRPADLEVLLSKLKSISRKQCYNDKNIITPPQCAAGCVYPSVCLLAVQPTCLPPTCTTCQPPAVTCTIPGSCTSTATTTATSTAVLTTTSTDYHTSTAVTTLETTETQTQTAIETSTHTTTATDTLTQTAVTTSTDFHTITETDTATQTNYVTETSTHTATSTKVHKTTETLSTTDIDTITSTHVTTATQTAIATSTAIATRYFTSTLLTTSLDIDTSTHITTATSTALETSTKTHVTTATDTSTAVTTATHMKTLTTTSTALTTSTHLKTDVSTKVLTDTRTLTTTQTKLASSTHVTTSTGVTTSTLFTTHTKTKTDTAVVTSTAFAVSTKVLTTTSTDLATSTHVTTATSTQVHTSTATDTKTLTTVSTDVSTSTHVATQTSTAVATKTSTAIVSVTDTQTKLTTATRTHVQTSTTTDTKTLTTVSTDVSTSTHITTQTSTAVATKTSTAVVSFTDTQTKFTTVTSTDVNTQITTATSTKVVPTTTTDTKTLTTVSTDVATSTHVTTHTSTAVVSVTDTKTQVETVTSTDVDTSTSTHVTTATITATRTSTAVATSTAVTTSTDTSTATEVLTTVETTTESLTKTKTQTSTVMSTSVVTSCSFNCPSTSPTPSLTSVPPTSTSVTPTPPAPGCGKELDVGILLHNSRNIPAQSFTTLKNFVAQFSSKFLVSPVGAHFGLISYGEETETDIKFSDLQYQNNENLQKKIKSLNQLSLGSRIDLAIEKASETLFSEAWGNRKDKPKTLIVFAEEGSGAGRKPYKQVIAPLVAKGVQIIAVGLTNKVTREELKEIANGNETNVFLVNSFDNLPSILKDLVQRACDAPEPEPFEPPEPPCTAVVDLVFVMDGSGSIERFGVGNFNRCKTFAKDMAKSFNISQKGTHVGLVLFSGAANVVFALNEHYDIGSIEKAIDGIVYPKGETYIGNALNLTKSGVIDVSARPNVHRIIILMTDGVSLDDVTVPSRVLKDGGNSLYVLGIGSNYDIDELKIISSDPDKDYVFTSGFDELDKAVKSIKEKACKEANKTLPTPKPEVVESCKKELDVGILLHNSQNIPSQSFTTLENFVAQFASKFSVSALGSHFGLISYGDESIVEFKFSDAQYYNDGKLQEKIKGLYQLGSGSRIDLAIEKANEKLFSKTGGYRTDKPKTLVVFAEEGSGAGKKPYAQVIAPLAAKGVQMIAVGMSNEMTREELKEIANGNETNVLLVNSFDNLSSILKNLVKKACDAPEPEPFVTPEPTQCSVEYKKLGCYNEQSSNPAMPERLLSSTPDWSDFASWLQKFVCQCAEKAKLKTYTVFGVRDTGECVSGPEAADIYLEYGESTNCVDGHFKTCRNDDKNECCGERNTNYVYGVITEGKEVTTPAPPTPTPTPAPCKAVVDLVFVMDGSGSIEHFGVGNFNRCKKFAKDMVKSFEVSQSGTHVGVVLFSSSASVVFGLDEHYDIPSIDKAIDDIMYPEGGTYIGNALDLTKSGVIDVGARSNVHRIIIVMTDGESNDYVDGPSKTLKDAGNSLYVLGIGSSVNIGELNKIASDPDKDYVFTSGFDELDKAVKSIKEKACKEATTPLPSPEPEVIDANFTRTPPAIVYIRIGMTVRFEWEYKVSNRNTAFARYSPIWYYYYSNGASVELASEDKNAAWQWSVSHTCPASYRERISKEGQATLVITSVSNTDGGYYGCSLMMVSGGPVLSKVQLVLLDARFIRTPPQVVYVYVGETVRLEWLYTIDGGRNNAFGVRSPTWNLYYSGGESAELAFEDKNNGWKWSLSESCPNSLRGRLTKESDAMLVISNVSLADSGFYGCSLVMVSGQPVISKIQLIIREKPKPEVFKVEFTKLPPREVYAYTGDDVKLEWEYTVTGDKNQGFARYSPTWNLYNQGEATELAAEDKYSSWKWKVSSTCPASLRNRLRKESTAHLVISKATIEDSGFYGCSLHLAFGEPLVDKVWLTVSDRPTQRPTGEVTPPCKAVVDLVFLIDGSTSIEQFGMGNFKRCLNFAKTMVRSFEVSSQGTHVGVVMFTNTAKVEFTLTKCTDAADIEHAIDAIRYPAGGTFAGEGLKVVKNEVFDVTGRAGVPHALIIMTDGQSIDDIQTPSTALKNDGTLIYCLGIGSEYNMQQLNTMASAPTATHVFVADFDKLDTVVESIKQKACSDANSVTPTIKPVTEQPVTPKPEVKCKTTVDLGFLIDGSTSIEMAGAGNFDRCKDFVKKMISYFDISQSGTHIGVAQFASRVFVNFTFNEYYDKAGLDKAIYDIPMLYGGTNLGKALTTVRTDLFDAGSRNNVPRILIVMSDGASEDAVDEPAKALRDQGVTIFCLGIGNKTNKQQLNIIASDPDSEHVFTSGFNELSNVVGLIEQKACPDTDIVTISGGISSSQSYSYGYCSVRYNKIGCYGDDQKDPRPLPTELFTDRNPDSDLFSGITTNLGQWDQYMSDVVCRCAKNAMNRDFKLFSIQNFGECWSGFDAEKTYNRNGESKSCISNKMEACDPESLLPCVGNKTSNYVYEVDFGDGKKSEACSVTYEKVGCFRDNKVSPRPFSDLVSTDLDPNSQVYSGSPMNKGDWNTYLADVVCRCAQNTQEYEYEYFGIQNLGECWTGPAADKTYNSDGQSDQCVSKDMQACVDDSRDNCVGQESTNFVYRIQKTDMGTFTGFD